MSRRTVRVISARDSSMDSGVGDSFEGDGSEESQRRQWRSHIQRMTGQDTTCRTIMVFGFFMVVLAGGLIAMAMLIMRTSFESTHVVIGPRGPQGSCNLSHSNQTFIIAGDTIIGSNLTVTNTLFVDDALSIYSNGTCVVINSTLPLCMDNCLKVDCIDASTPNGNITFGGSIVETKNSYFYGTVFINTTLDIGGASFFWNGTTLIFTGPSNLGSLVTIPINVSGTGTIGTSGPCMFFDAVQCIVFAGNVTFLDPIQGPLIVNGSTTFDPAIFIHNSSFGLEWTGTVLNLFSLLSELDLTSPVDVVINTPITNVTGNLTLGGTVVDLLKLSQNGLQTTCLPGPQTGALGFDANCSCLMLTSTSGICLNASGTEGITATGGGNFTIIGPTMNLNFANGSTIGTSVTVNGDVTTTGDVNVGGSLTVADNVTFTNITVTGSTTFEGNVSFTNSTVFFESLNVTSLVANITMSETLTTFYGLGAFFAAGTVEIASNISISTIPSHLFCTSPIFSPDTLSTPNPSPCVVECTDMARCSPTVLNISVIGNIDVGDVNPTKGNATFGTLHTKPLGHFRVNADDVEIESDSNSIKILGSLDVTGPILQGGMTHPCCSGIGSITQWLVVEMNTVTASIATSELTVIPFNLVQTPSSSLTPAFNIFTSTFSSPASAQYTITIYLSMDPAQFNQGTFRGVTLYRSFSNPASGVVPIRVCSQKTNFAVAPVPFQITCTYSGLFMTGDTFFTTAFFDFAGPLTLNGAGSGVSKPTTRLEIYQF